MRCCMELKASEKLLMIDTMSLSDEEMGRLS